MGHVCSTDETPLASASRPPPLRVDHMRKSFGARDALIDFSLTLEAGEVLGLLGPNGAGKTTAISCLAGLLRPDRGAVSICGVDALSKGRKARLNLGLATQTSALYPPLDVVQNLGFYAALGGASGAEVDRMVKRTIDRFQLDRLLGRPVGRLSGGQRRLIHVASAVVREPPVVVLDEATANLDVRMRRLVIQLVSELAAEGCAILYSSHYMEEIEGLCDRVLVLHKGAIIAEGRVGDLVDAHGGGRVEFIVDGQPLSIGTPDLPEALRSVESVDRIESARVIRPSLEAVFIALTGEGINDLGFAHSDKNGGGEG